MSGKFNWYAVGQTVVAGVAVAGILFAFSVSTRLTRLEAGTNQEQMGYSVALAAMRERMDKTEAWQLRIEGKIDILMSKAHTHGGN